MKEKFLRGQLWLLFGFTALNFLYFYYQSDLPDHLYHISSENSSHPLLYYATSALAWMGFYSGIWVFLPFFAFLLFYAFSLSKKQDFWDVLAAPLLILLFLTGSYLFLASFVGKGLYFWLHQKFSQPWIIFSFIASFLLSFSLLFRKAAKILALKSLKIFDLKLPSFKISMPTKLKSLWENFKEKRRKASLLSDTQEKTPEQIQEPIQEKKPQLQLLKTEAPKPELIKAPEELAVSVAKPAIKNSYTSEELISFLNSEKGSSGQPHPDKQYFQDIIESIEEKFKEFKLQAKIINILKGPVVDTFEVELGAGIKVSRLTSLTEDLSLALCGTPLRMVYPLKGRSTIGIEVPRNPREIIFLDEIFSTKNFQDSKNKLPIAMGKDAFGETLVVDLAAMPHMLIAGATGAGKSVFINTLLVSLLVKLSPKKMKLILVDPKQLELALYANLPHLVLPVVTDPKRASLALLWSCQEMERRYSILKELGVRNIEGFNKKVTKASPHVLSQIAQYYDDESQGYELPYLVIVVDEFADLILTKEGKDIETNICRLAAKARACGIHLVLATQRPSVDVITGLIKSNFPTRVSFRVTSSIDSRTILNSVGAEKLLGKGDMLYKHGVEMTRVHAAYVDEDEIEGLMDKLCEVDSEFNEQALNFLEKGEEEANAFPGESSPAPGEKGLYDQAVEVVLKHKAASASMLQRRLRIGYNRAANLIEMMEERGIVGPSQGSKPREILSRAE